MAGKGEEEVAEAVHVDEQYWVNRSFVGEVEDSSLGTAGHGAAHISERMISLY